MEKFVASVSGEGWARIVTNDGAPYLSFGAALEAGETLKQAFRDQDIEAGKEPEDMAVSVTRLVE